MADDKQKNADFIDRVVGDAKNPPETRMLTGWFGDSGEEDFRRLYADAELNSYVDIPDDAILYSEPLRDTQPSGCVMVWIKRDAALKQGGSAASRAARFLQGQVQQDFASAGAAGSLEKAGLRCVTEVPCGEPTGFTGQCTKQPEVGGAWPCITAIPHCFEVTGFTGKCTHAPWPNPTRYIGCTVLHCPTNDLTHIPHICNIVASGQPGCVIVNPPQGGDPEQRVAASAEADEKAAPATSIPGCGYTKTWGVCETHLLGCGTAAQDSAAAAQAQPASAICATAIGCDITLFCHTRIQPLCFPTPICPTQPRLCFPIPSPFCPVTQACPFNPAGGGDPAQRFAAFGAAAPVLPTVPATPCNPSQACDTKPPTALCTPDAQFCPTFCGSDCQTKQPHPVCTSVNCLTKADPQCSPSNIYHDCTSIGSTCPTKGQPGCPTVFPCQNNTLAIPICNLPNVADAQAFGAAAPRPIGPTQIGCPPSDFVACSQFGGCPSAAQQIGAAGRPIPICTQGGPQCPTYPNGDCTFFGCPSRGIDCTVITCTHVGPQCPPHPSLQGQYCPVTELCPVTPLCQVTHLCPITNGGPQWPVHIGFNCPSQFGCQSIACQSIACQPGGGGQQQQAAFGAAQPQAAPAILPNLTLGPQCVSHLLGCTYFGPQCRTYPRGDCTFFGCPSPGIDCTVVTCTHVGPRCPQPSLQGQLCPVTELCPQTQLCPVSQLCPITNGGPQCPVHSGFNCPSQGGCQSIACQSIACQPGGGGEQQQAFARQAVGAPQSAATVCTQVGAFCQHTSGPTICTQIGPQCPHTAGCPTPLCTHIGAFCQHTSGLTICTQIGPQCPHTAGCPTPLCTQIGCPNTLATVCTQTGPQCPPHPSLQAQFCPITAGAPQCPVASGFNCPSQVGCQSIACGQSVACVSAGCQPGGGQQAFGAAPAAAAGGGGGIGVTTWDDCTHFGWQCPPFFTQFERECVVQPIFTFGPQCPPQTVACPPPPPPTPFCPSHHLVICTAFGPQCPRTVVEPRGPAFTFFNPCNSVQIDCWFANYWANFRA